MNYEISYILKTSSLDSFQLYVYARAVQAKVGLQLRSKTKRDGHLFIRLL